MIKSRTYLNYDASSKRKICFVYLQIFFSNGNIWNCTLTPNHRHESYSINWLMNSIIWMIYAVQTLTIWMKRSKICEHKTTTFINEWNLWKIMFILLRRTILSDTNKIRLFLVIIMTKVVFPIKFFITFKENRTMSFPVSLKYRILFFQEK